MSLYTHLSGRGTRPPSRPGARLGRTSCGSVGAIAFRAGPDGGVGTPPDP